LTRSPKHPIRSHWWSVWTRCSYKYPQTLAMERQAQAFVSDFSALKKMEYHIFKTLVISSALIVLLYSVIRAVYIIWLRPKSLEKYLRRQGIRGTSYKLLYGDMKEIKKSTMDAWSKPMSLKHQIAPRVSPFFHQMVQKYGKQVY
jgi:hypothetical protein